MASSFWICLGNERRWRIDMVAVFAFVCVGLLSSRSVGRRKEKDFVDQNHDSNRRLNVVPPWYERWDKTYNRVLSESGFDKIVGPCPNDEDRFYDKGSKKLDGKYEWYCASRAKYLEGSKRETPLQLTGYSLFFTPARYVSKHTWQPGDYDLRVSFNKSFYPLADGQCYVDFADEKVGGGVFRYGLAQEEKLMLQLPELLLVVRERALNGRGLHLSTPKEYLAKRDSPLPHLSDVIVFKSALRRTRTLPKSIDLACGRPPKSATPCADYVNVKEEGEEDAVVTIIAVNAEYFPRDGYYQDHEFTFLADKVLGAFAAARDAGCHSLNSGSLGAGVFNGNLDLAVLLHATMSIAFGIPVTMWGLQERPRVREIVSWIEEKHMVPLTIRTVLEKLQRGILWGHGPNNKHVVQVHDWDCA